jgi:drug/metabolite transporter (DMT)-like permease
MPSEEATVPITINWQKSSFSSEGSACVELGIATEGTVLLRESDDPTTVLVTTLLLTPVAMSRRKEIRVLWRAHKPEVLGVAVLSPLSYILVLMALVFTPVSYVAPAREISILIGAAMGARLLSEGDSTRRLIAAGAMVVGIIALALG